MTSSPAISELNLPPECLAELEQARAALTEALRKPGRRDCGFKRGDEALIKFADGDYNEVEILRQTHFECYHCGSHWPDTPSLREALDRSSHYVPARPTALPSNLGFNFPQWINRRLPWGEMMLAYLKAKKAEADFGNLEQIKQWWQKVAGRTWNPNLTQLLRVLTQEKYDLKSDWPEEWRGHRCLIVDCQQDLQYFWVSAWAVSKTGKSRQLWRGICHGFGPCGRPPAGAPAEAPDTVGARQREFGILDQFVFLDGNYMKNELVEECAKHGHWATYEGEKDWFCWTLLIGSPQKDFSHKDDKNSKVRHPVSDPYYEYPALRVDKYRVSVEVYYFSALQMGDMWVRYRDGHGPETLFLPETESPENRTSWTAQIHAPKKQHLVNKQTGEMKEIYKPPTQTTPHHYFDIGRMFMAVHVIWGISGHFDHKPPVTVLAAGHQADGETGREGE